MGNTKIRKNCCKKRLEIIALLSFFILCAVLTKTQFNNSLVIKNVPEDFPLQTTNNGVKERMKAILNCKDVELRQEKLQYGEYWLIKNYIRGQESINVGCGETITYAANGDYEFLGHLATVVERWLAPISFALYTPGYDYNTTMDSIQYVRHCLPQSQLIRDYVSFHVFFPKDHMPVYIANNEEEAINWSYDCDILEPPYAKAIPTEMYRKTKNLTYPINVARNIARKNVNTHFVFACDIELHPSLGLVDKFLELVMNNTTAILEGEKPKVFVLPVFEIEETATMPNSKLELQQMLNDSLAVPFHQLVCRSCHLIPKQEEWINANDSTDLTVFAVGKRYGNYKSWEPFYISDNREPIFDERVTWEGQSNKRIQNYAMCLLDYEYHILHPAFLVHAPGIKRISLKSDSFKKRSRYATAMSLFIRNEILPEYQVLFGKNKKCSV